MGQIEKLHDYLNSLEETGKVLSFATILKIGEKLIMAIRWIAYN